MQRTLTVILKFLYVFSPILLIILLSVLALSTPEEQPVPPGQKHEFRVKQIDPSLLNTE